MPPVIQLTGKKDFWQSMRLIESDDTNDGLKSLRSVQTAYLEKTKNPKITGSYYVNAALSVALLIGDAPALLGEVGK